MIKKIYAGNFTEDTGITRQESREIYKKGDEVLMGIDAGTVYIIPAENIRKAPSASDEYRWLTSDPGSAGFVRAWGTPINLLENDALAIFEVDDRATGNVRKHLALMQKAHIELTSLYDAHFNRRSIINELIEYDKMTARDTGVLIALCGLALGKPIISIGALLYQVIFYLRIIKYPAKINAEKDSLFRSIKERENAENALLDALREADGWYDGV